MYIRPLRLSLSARPQSETALIFVLCLQQELSTSFFWLFSVLSLYFFMTTKELLIADSHFLFWNFYIYLEFSAFSFYDRKRKTKRSSQWRYNTIVTDEAVECLESSQQRQHDRGQQYCQRQWTRPSTYRSGRRQKVNEFFFFSFCFSDLFPSIFFLFFISWLKWCEKKRGAVVIIEPFTW